jgi:hypothetical protein
MNNLANMVLLLLAGFHVYMCTQILPNDAAYNNQLWLDFFVSVPSITCIDSARRVQLTIPILSGQAV